jgi:dihydrofolate reductase
VWSDTNRQTSEDGHEDLTWNNSHLITGDVAAEVSKLKDQPGKDILLYDSDMLVNLLLDRGLIDDFRLWVFPLVLGAGGSCSTGRTREES